MSGNNKGTLGVFSLVMINFAAIANVRSLPSIAPYGLSMLFFYIVATLAFLVPSALVSAELASGFPGNGGIYHWVSTAFGKRVGFLAAWLQNSNNFLCFPASLSFIASTLAYGMFPELVDSKAFTICVILSIIWIGTFLTLKGAELTAFISTIGGIIGTFLPVLLIVSLGVIWIASGRPLQIKFSLSELIPDLSVSNNIALFSGVLLGFAGLEMSANHVNDVSDPQKKYPLAIFLSSFLILVVSVLGALAIAIVVPKNEIMMNTGVMQALSLFFSEFNIPWMTTLLSLAITIGSITWFCAWVSGPPRALHATVADGELPQFFGKLNKHGMPTNIMILQAVISSALSVLFVFAESVNVAFWMLIIMTSQFLLFMYVLMFAAAIVLRFKFPNVERAYSVPFGKAGMILTSGTGLLVCAIFYLISFFPPSDINVKNPVAYALVILGGNILIGFLPYVILQFVKNRKTKKIAEA